MSVSTKTVEPNAVKLVIAAVLALVAAYIFGALAIDRGNIFYYAFTFVAVFVAGRFLWKAIKGWKNGR